MSATAAVGMAGGALNEKYEFVQPQFDLKPGLTTITVGFRPLLLGPGDYSIDLHIFDPTDHSGYTSAHQYFFKS